MNSKIVSFYSPVKNTSLTVYLDKLSVVLWVFHLNMPPTYKIWAVGWF